jgi:hypothetical protein
MAADSVAFDDSVTAYVDCGTPDIKMHYAKRESRIVL